MGRTINPLDFLKDIRAGLDNHALMQKYDLPPSGLRQAFDQLLRNGWVSQAELDHIRRSRETEGQRREAIERKTSAPRRGDEARAAPRSRTSTPASGRDNVFIAVLAGSFAVLIVVILVSYSLVKHSITRTMEKIPSPTDLLKIPDLKLPVPSSGSPGETATETSIVNQDCFGAAREEDVPKIVELRSTGDDEGKLGEMFFQGRVMPLSQGTKVTLLETRKNGTSCIRLRGLGSRWWLPSDWIDRQ